MQPHPYLPPTRPAATQQGLTRYSSAPAGSSYLSALVDSVLAGSALPAEFHGTGTTDHLLETSSGHGSSAVGVGFFPEEIPSFRSPGALDTPPQPAQRPYNPLDELLTHHISTTGTDLVGVGGHDAIVSSAAAAVSAAVPTQPSSLLFRHNSSPAGVFNQLLMDEHVAGFSVGRAGGGLGTYSQQAGGLPFHGNSKKLRSQLSYPSRQDSLSSISEISIPNVGASSDAHAGSDFQVGGSWDDGGAMAFRGNTSVGLERHLSRDSSGDFMSSLDDMDSPFNLPSSSLEMAAMEQLLQIHQDSVACKVRARRGCATHPRSIAERARRTRISEKLKKLQDLVPNMDKQTNTADMLDLAVQHIKGLQSQVQKLNEEQSNCICSRPGPYGL